MSVVSSSDAPTASENAIGTAARSQWSFGILFSRAIVIVIGIAVGLLVGVFIGLLTGLIQIQIC